MTEPPPDTGTDQVVATGSLGLDEGDAFAELVASVLTSADDQSVLAFSSGNAFAYELGAGDIGPVSGHLDVGLTGGVFIFVGGDVAGLTDFAFFAAAEADPARAIATDDNNGTVTGGVGSAWTRHSMVFTPPREHRAWKRAAFAAVGFVYKSMPTVTVQHLDDVQFEIAPVDTTVPQTFDPARTLNVRVRPTRLNHSTNPSFEIDTTDWTVEGGSISRITTDAAQGTACLQATGLSATTSAVRHVVRSLVPGRIYIASVYLRSMDTGDAAIEVHGDRATVGGIATGPRTWQTAVIGSPDPDWRRVWVSFTADSAVASVYVRSLGAATVLIDGLLIEEGNGLGVYFDGASGVPDYAWETTGVAGKTRSYYYRNKTERHYALNKTLRENVAQGIFIGDPEYATSATFTSTPYGDGPYGSGPYGG